jgi:hypothetical protein
VTYEDNPFCPEVMRLEAARMKAADADAYEHIWMGGYFLGGNGRVYSSFINRPHPTGNIDESIVDAGGELLVGMDFNVNPMSAVVGQRAVNELLVLDAIEIQTSNTEEMAEELKRRYPPRPDRFGQLKPRRIIVCPDPAGKQRKTSAPVGQTDFTILQRHGFEVRAPNAAPPVVDRINNSQQMLAHEGKRRTRIHPRAKPLITALANLVYKDGTSQPDKKSGFDHMCDALGYLHWQEFNVLELQPPSPSPPTTPTELLMADQSQYDRPSTPCAAYVQAAPDIMLIRDLLGGTRCMHEQFKVYIPKYKAEKPDAYKRRATSATVYGGLGRTLSAANGMLFAKPPEKSKTGWTPELESHFDNIDGKGTGGVVFVKRRSEDSMADGFTVILVDHPQPPNDVEVHAGNEKALNLRPFWSSYTRADVLSWRTAVVKNVETVVQVVLREAAYVNEGRFGVLPRTRYRVCALTAVGATWQLLEEQKNAGGNVVAVTQVGAGAFVDRSGAPFDIIPIAVIYAGRTDAILTAHPPLLDVAYANLQHWRKATNLSFYEDQCCFPQPTITGELARDPNGAPMPFTMGPAVLVQVTAGSTYEMKELTGSSLATLRDGLATMKDEISELGMSFLAKKTRGVETAEAKRLDAAAENSTLATSAQGIEDGINQALMLHARYLGIPAEQAPTLKLNRDFDQLAMDAATMTVYVQAVAQAGLPVRLLLQSWQAGGRISPDVDLEELEAEMMANAAAAEAQKKQSSSSTPRRRPRRSDDPVEEGP